MGRRTRRRENRTFVSAQDRRRRNCSATILDATGTGTILNDDVATQTPTATTTTHTSTATPISTATMRNFDVQPDPLDGRINALDLFEWLRRIRQDEENGDLLLEFGQVWQTDGSPP